MNTTEDNTAPRIHEKSIAALRATRPWALVVSVVALVLAAASLVHLFVYSLAGLQVLPAGSPQYLTVMFSGFLVVGAILGLVANALFAWFSLQYGRGIKATLEQQSAERLEEAMWWQKRYWTLQGVLVIVGIVLAVVAVIALPIIAGSYHGGYDIWTR